MLAAQLAYSTEMQYSNFKFKPLLYNIYKQMTESFWASVFLIYKIGIKYLAEFLKELNDSSHC